jgi:hypothetical protein
MTAKDLIKKFKNRKGDLEAETILTDNNREKRQNNTVSIWSSTADISKIASRCGSAIKSVRIEGDGAFLDIDRRAFRGVEYAFKILKD